MPYGFAQTSGELDDAVNALAQVMQDMLRLAEVGKGQPAFCAGNRTHPPPCEALEYVKIPQMEESIHYISMKLDENERANTIRLMKRKDLLLKESIEARREQDAQAMDAFRNSAGRAAPV